MKTVKITEEQKDKMNKIIIELNIIDNCEHYFTEDPIYFEVLENARLLNRKKEMHLRSLLSKEYNIDPRFSYLEGTITGEEN